MKFKLLVIIMFSFVATYIFSSSHNKDNSIRKKVFQYLKSRHELLKYENYNRGYDSFPIYDICFKGEIRKIKNKCVCGFGVFNEDQNYYLFFKNGELIVFINPMEMTLEESLEQLSIVFHNGYPCDKEFVIQYVKDFYMGNKNTLIFINGIGPSGTKIDSTIIPL